MCSSVAVDGSLVVVVSSCPVIITVSPESYLRIIPTWYPAVKTSILGFVCVKHLAKMAPPTPVGGPPMLVGDRH
jgi:hypothetical protein